MGHHLSAWPFFLQLLIFYFKFIGASSKAVVEEAKIMRDLSHRNVLNLVAIIKEELNYADYDILIITPFMVNGDLKSYVERNYHSVESDVSIEW